MTAHRSEAHEQPLAALALRAARAGAAAIAWVVARGDFLAWAHGECDAFVGCGLAEWDTAAGQAIVLAARGAGRKLGTPDFDIRVAASTPLVAGLCDIVGSLRPH